MISLIIPFYKRINFLHLVLQGIHRQSYKDFEVIIAEDDNDPATLALLDTARKQYDFPIKHVSQDDRGFRKSRIMNAAIRAAEGEQLVFLDGDCIPHKHYLKEYAKAIRTGKICYGRRVFLSQQITAQLAGDRQLARLRFLRLLFSGSRGLKNAIYNPYLKNISKQYRPIIGCNWGIRREHIIRVNGFDEDCSIIDDADIGWRLKATGMRMECLKNRAIVYHLHHPPCYNELDTLRMTHLMHQKMKEGRVYCLNGINNLTIN
jgi:cellulose synthase/poly-beta-1,6-N-acetylglucosamine synthase-like glycosyltransferase